MSATNIRNVLDKLKKSNPSDCIDAVKNVDNLKWNDEFVSLSDLYIETLIRLTTIAIVQQNLCKPYNYQLYNKYFSNIIFSIENADILDVSTEFSDYFMKFKQCINKFDKF